MKTSWEKTRSGHTHYCTVYPRQVELGDHHGSGRTDTAGRCTHQEFLEGRYQAEIRRVFGPRVLAQVIAAVEGIARQPDVAQGLRLDEEELDNWERIPVVEELARIAREADEDGRRDNYGRGRAGSTVVQLTDTVRVIGGRHPRWKSYFVHADGTRQEVPLWSMPMIAHRGLLYCASLHLYVYDASATCLFDTESVDHRLGIGRQYSIRNVLRKGDVMMFSYENLRGDEYPRSAEVLGREGVLRLELDRGFVGRAVVDLATPRV